jgi:predicted small lipoprotein YifL
MKRHVLPAGLAYILVTVLAGCGQKGPLYLPDEARDVVTRPATPSPESPESAPPGGAAPDEDKDKDGDPPR